MVKISPVSPCLLTLESSGGWVFGEGIALYCGGLLLLFSANTLTSPASLASPDNILNTPDTDTAGRFKGVSVCIYTITSSTFNQLCYQDLLAQGRNMCYFLVQPRFVDTRIKSNPTESHLFQYYKAYQHYKCGFPGRDVELWDAESRKKCRKWVPLTRSTIFSFLCSRGLGICSRLIIETMAAAYCANIG